MPGFTTIAAARACVAITLFCLASCGDGDSPKSSACRRCYDPDGGGKHDAGPLDGAVLSDAGDGGEEEPRTDGGGDASADADVPCCAEPEILGVSFQQLWPYTEDGQTSPHMQLTGILFIPGDRGLLIWEKAGRISHYSLEGDALTLLGELRLEDVLSYSDCGMTSVVLDPEWESNHYLFATHCLDRQTSVLVRYEFDAESYDIAESRALVLEVGDSRATKAWHNLGGIGFFDDAEHSMWVLAGEKDIDEHSQDLSTNLGKALRIIPRRGEGSAGYDPHPDNPFAGDPASSSGPDIYAWGLRSPWRGAIDRDGRLFVGDVGGSKYEEVNVVTRPAQNFGWADFEGPCKPADRDCSGFSDPAASWNRSSDHRYRKEDADASPAVKRCAWVGTPYEPSGADRYTGFLDDSILFSDMCVGFVRALSVNEDGETVRDEHVGNLPGLSGAAVGPDGYLYVTSYGSCASTSSVGGGVFRVLPRTAGDPSVLEPPLTSEPLVEEPLGPLPEKISQTGIFADAELSEPIDRVIRYTPTLPLWSNGSDKERWLLLPRGARVDNSDRDAWDFPTGTLFFKTFAYEGADEERVETRIIRRTESGYDYHAYRWNALGTDATLMSLEVGTHAGVTLADGTSFGHIVPSRFDCRSCHESNDTVIIGFDELRLNGPAQTEAQTQLITLAEAGVFEVAVPPDPRAVVDADLTTQQVLGYLHGNCAHCHNESPQTMSVLSLEHDVALENMIGVPTMGSGQASGIRVVPQSPETSVLFLAFSEEGDDPELQAMPPIGVTRIDEDTVELLRGWIDALPADTAAR